MSKPKRGKRADGEGTLYQRKDGLWTAQMSVRATGKRLTFYGKTQQEALDKLKAAQAKELSGTLVESSDATVEQWLTMWLELYKKHEIRPTTWDSYEYLCRVHIVPVIGHIKLQQLKPFDLQQLYNLKLKTLSRRTVALIHTVIKASLTQAKKSQLVSANVAEAVKPPQQKKPEKRALSTAELNQFLETASTHRLYPAIVLAATTGLRRGEILALRWDDIDFDQGVVFVRRGLVLVNVKDGPTKTKLIEQPTKTRTGQRVLPIPKPVLEVLKEHQKVQEQEKLIQGHRYLDRGLVFSTITGNYISPRNFTRTFAQIRKKAGLEGVSPHVLRHTFATRLADLGVHPRVAQQLLGHANVQLTMEVYTHPDLQQHRQAMDKLGSTMGDIPALQYCCSKTDK